MAKILIVGGTGYLGKPLVEKLSLKNTVYYSGRGSKDNAQYLSIDFNDPKSYIHTKKLKFDIVFITACNLDNLNRNTLDRVFEENTTKYGAFLNFLIDHRVSKKFIYTSSMTVYNSDNSVPVKENASVINQPNAYGFSKRVAEQITEFLCLKNNVRGVSIRLPGLFGGNREGGLIYNTIVNASMNKQITINTQGLAYWESMYLPTVVEVISSFIEHYNWDQPFDVFNVGYGEKQNIKSVVSAIKKIINSASILSFKNIPEAFYLETEKINVFNDFHLDLEKDLIQYIEILKNKTMCP